MQRGLCSYTGLSRLISSDSFPGGVQWLPHTWDFMCRAGPAAVPVRLWADALEHEQPPHWPLAQIAPPTDSGYCRDGAIHVTTMKICSQLVSQTFVSNFLQPSLSCVSREGIIVSGWQYYPPFIGGETEGQSWEGAASPPASPSPPFPTNGFCLQAPSLNPEALTARREITAH